MEGVEKLPNEQFYQLMGFPNYYISNQGRCYDIKTKRFIDMNKLFDELKKHNLIKDGYVFVKDNE